MINWDRKQVCIDSVKFILYDRIAELAKKIVDENQARKAREDYGFEDIHETTYSKENPVEHALMVKASEADDNRLVG